MWVKLLHLNNAMYKGLCALLLLFSTAAGWCQTKGSRTFDLALPKNLREASAVVVVFKDLEVPANRPVVFRLYGPGQSVEQSLGSFSVMGKSRDAKGMQHVERIEANITEEFLRWAEKAKPGSRVSILVKPFAGLKEAEDYPWTVKEVELETR